MLNSCNVATKSGFLCDCIFTQLLAFHAVIGRSYVLSNCSGVAGPLAAQGGGQICRPFVLGF